MTRRVRRSGLTMPINNPRFVGRSWTRNCDFLNFDFEDSVPQSQKEHARTVVAEAIAQAQKGSAEVNIRVNCAYPEADVRAAVLPGVSRINHPKSETAEQIRNIDALITEMERESDEQSNVNNNDPVNSLHQAVSYALPTWNSATASAPGLQLVK